MKTDLLTQLPSLLQATLRDWEQANQPLEDFLSNLLTPADTTDLLEMVDAIRAADAALKQSGRSPRLWLGQKLAKVSAELVEVPGLDNALDLEPVELGSAIIDLGLEQLRSLGEALTGGITEGLLDGDLAIVNRFFQSVLGDAVEREIVAVSSGAVLKLAGQLGLKTNTAAVTGAVDLGLRAAKIAFHLADGRLDDDEAFAELEDRVAAVVAAGVDRLIEAGAPRLGTAIGTFIGTALGNPILGGTVGAAVASFAAGSIRPIIRRGVRKVVMQTAKLARRTISTALQKLTSSILD